MIHYTCDRCKCEINPDEELRYSINVEIKAVFETPTEPIDDATDHLLELSEMLERLDDQDNGSLNDDVYQRRRYDMCCDCYQQYQKNPLGRETPLSLGFSAN